MVKKLFKHEIRSYLRVVLPVYGILLAVAALARVIQFFENDSTVYSIISGSSIFAYVVGLIAAFGMTLVLGVVRYYRNMFTAEGYLTLTLPVTPTQHVLVKVLTATLFQMVTVIVMLLSAAVIMAGDVFTEVVKAGVYLLDWLAANMEVALWPYVLEAVVLLLVVSLMGFLLYYACISIGQQARKNRVLAAVGAYFGYYLITQVIGTIELVVFMLIQDTQLMQDILDFIGEHPYATAHIALCGFTVLSLLMAMVYFLICRWVLRRRLNLE